MKGYVRDGRYYRRRDGVIVGPARVGKNGTFPWQIDGKSYTNHGTFFMVGGKPSQFDLVEEVEVRAPLVPRRTPLPIVEGASYRLDTGAVTGPLRKEATGRKTYEWSSGEGMGESLWTTPFLEAHAIEIVETPETLSMKTGQTLLAGRHAPIHIEGPSVTIPAHPPFRLERGKEYVARDGSRIGPMAEDKDAPADGFRFLAHDPNGRMKAWRADGTHGLTTRVEHPLDLVAEWVEPEQPAIVIESLPAQAEEDPRDLKIADAYQVVGNLLSASGAFETEEGRRALDYFGLSETYDPEFLPWPREPLPDLPGEIEALREALRAANRKIAELAGAEGGERLPAGSTVRHGDASITYGSGIEPWDLFAAHALGGFAGHLVGVSQRSGENGSEADVRGAAARADALMAERAKRGVGK